MRQAVQQPPLDDDLVPDCGPAAGQLLQPTHDDALGHKIGDRGQRDHQDDLDHGGQQSRRLGVEALLK